MALEYVVLNTWLQKSVRLLFEFDWFVYMPDLHDLLTFYQSTAEENAGTISEQSVSNQTQKSCNKYSTKVLNL